MKYFTIEEMCRSAKAEAMRIDNTPPRDAVMALETLVECVLDPLREAYGNPIIVNSGYRCELLNEAVGGRRNSQHKKGEAADITVGSKEGNKWLFNYIRDHLDYDQLIDEYDYSWVHVSYDAGRCNRREIIHER